MYIVAESFTIPVLEYDATSTIGRKILPEPPTEVSNLLKPGTIQALEGIIDHKLKRPFYLAQVLVSDPSMSLLSIHVKYCGSIGKQSCASVSEHELRKTGFHW